METVEPELPTFAWRTKQVSRSSNQNHVWFSGVAGKDHRGFAAVRNSVVAFPPQFAFRLSALFRTTYLGSKIHLALMAALGILACSCSSNSELARVKAAAKRGDAEAQYQLGEYYHDRVEVAPDYEAAAAWFGRAARQGHAAAQHALGKKLLNAEGALPDEVQAANWIRKSAEQGYAPAQDELASLYAGGLGVPQDEAEAVKWATRAAEQDYADAQYHLGCLLSSGTAGEASTNKVAACFWFTLAAADGHQESEDLLNTLKQQLTPQQAEDVKQQAEQWKRKTPGRE